MVKYILISAILCSTLFCNQVMAQVDSLPVLQSTGKGKNLLASDTSLVKQFNPRKATIRSAILPGWGQFYNKKYWKIPIVWGALGVSAGIFMYNLKTYKEFRRAVILRSDTIPGNDTLIPPDIRPLSTASLQFYRNTFRQDIDYSVLAFLLLWGLNVVDATVDAHLKSFDVGPSLSMKVRPNYFYPTNSGAISLVFDIHPKKYRFRKPH